MVVAANAGRLTSPRNAGRDEVFRFGLEMELHLVGEVAFRVGPEEFVIASPVGHSHASAGCAVAPSIVETAET